MKVIETELQNWKIEINWIKAHAGHHGNELADQLAKDAATSRDINVCYKRNPKSAVLRELNELRVTKWQREWDNTTKGEITRNFFPKIADRLKLKINITPKFTAIVTTHGSITSYLYNTKQLTAQCAATKAQNKQQTAHCLIVNYSSRKETDYKMQYCGQ
jgi:hypothetical protein